MLSNGTALLNDHVNGTNAHTLECPSDYPPAIDITPSKPTPQWRNEFPQFTHNLSWTDLDGINHSMTLRSDSLQSLMADLKLLKSMVRQAKQQHADASPVQPDTQLERVMCKVHGTVMERRVSKRTGGHYHCHKLAGRDLCFGRAKS